VTDSLGDILADLLDEMDVEVSATREYARDGVPFAWRPEEEVLEVRLGQDIAEAAMRTPDTHLSDRGSAWVRFAPPAWDEHSRDRAEAWFRVAWRLAEGR
jgi:hypothetical protein